MQSDDFNRSRIATVIVLVITSNVKLAQAPGNVLLSRKATGLSQDSVANVSQIVTVDKGLLKVADQHALARTYAAFARQYPELTASLLNESFLTIEAAPELAKFLTRHQHPDHTQLVR